MHQVKYNQIYEHLTAKGGEYMSLKSKMIQHRAAIGIGLTLAASFAMTGIASAATVGDFGLGYGSSTGLGNTDVRTTIASIINVALSLLGIIALVIILVGGFKWMTAGGNEEKVGEARKLIFSGIIGLAIILSAFAIASFVLNQLKTATGAS